MTPKILFLDIESAGVNALRADLGFVIVFGYKWAHEPIPHAYLIGKKDLKAFNDKPLLIKASKLIAEADLVVGHFASVFDRRFIRGRLLIHNLPPIPATRLRDTCMIARSVANFSSNRLKHLTKILKMKHHKTDNNWPEAWFKVMQGDMSHLRALGEYCKGDVLALEELYFRLRPHDNAHPRIVEDRSKCGGCGGPIQYRGNSFVGTYKYRRFQCFQCGQWDRERKHV